MRRRIELYFDGELSLDQEMALFRELEQHPQWLLDLTSAQTVLEELSARVAAPSDLQVRVMNRLGVRANGGACGTSPRRSGYARRVKWITSSSALLLTVVSAIVAGAWLRGHLHPATFNQVVQAGYDSPASSLDSMVGTAGNEISQRPGLTRVVSQVVLFLESDDPEGSENGTIDISHGTAGKNGSIPVRLAVVGWWPSEQDTGAHTSPAHQADQPDQTETIVWAAQMTPGRAADFLDTSPAATHIIGPRFKIVGDGIHLPAEFYLTARPCDGPSDRSGFEDVGRYASDDPVIMYDDDMWLNLDAGKISLLWGSGAWAVLDQPVISTMSGGGPEGTRARFDQNAPGQEQFNGLLPQQAVRPPLPTSAYPDFSAARKQIERTSRR